jgi:thioester reductase-like protein
MTSNRERGDKTWNYLRIIPAVKPYVWMKPVTNDTFEFVALNGLKSLVTTNSQSYHSRDLWTPHPSIPDAWKYIGRLDDRVTLANGEKVLPLPIEGRIRQDPLVKEAVVFGVGRDIPGLLLFTSNDARDLSDEDLVQKIWPTVEDANSGAEAFSQIGRYMIIPISADRTYAQTDKGTIVRAKIYQEFADVIERAYDESTLRGEAFENISSRTTVEQLEDLVYGNSGILGINRPADLGADLFNAGLDSLKAIQLARTIRTRIIPPEKRPLTRMDQNVIYEQGNLEMLATYLNRFLHGDATEPNEISHVPEEVVQERMRELISQHSIQFTTAVNDKDSMPRSRSTSSSANPLEQSKTFSVLLTGGTGSLGSHIIVSLLAQEHIDKVYCLLRSSSLAEPNKSVIKATHGNDGTREAIRSRVCFLKADITSGPELGLQSKDLEEIRKNVRLIIHCGWAVNFNIPLESFAPSLEGTVNLLKFCSILGSDRIGTGPEPKFVFISSISVTMSKGNLPGSSPSSTTCQIPEAPISDLGLAQETGYGRSKLCAEHIIAKAAAQGLRIDARILRVGQVVGDKHDCVWNANESIPLMLRTAQTISALPTLDENCAWLPVDTVADAVVEIALADLSSEEDGELESSVRYYNIVNNTSPFHWTSELLPALKDAGLRFRSVPPVEWILMLGESLKVSSSDERTREDPSMKLFDFWERRYGRKDRGTEENEKSEVRFNTREAEAHSQTMRSSIPKLIQEGYIRHFLEGWKDIWTESLA